MLYDATRFSAAVQYLKMSVKLPRKNAPDNFRMAHRMTSIVVQIDITVRHTSILFMAPRIKTIVNQLTLERV